MQIWIGERYRCVKGDDTGIGKLEDTVMGRGLM